jgi:outer membrane protein OmpA-like peptidoglycan-associated protein
VKTFVYAAEELFEEPETAKLKHKKRLHEVGAYLETNPFGVVVVQAFSSQAGASAENLVLTQAQAMVVRHVLADTFEVDDTKLKTKGMGEVDSTPPGRTRWIEISVYAQTVPPKVASSP